MIFRKKTEVKGDIDIGGKEGKGNIVLRNFLVRYVINDRDLRGLRKNLCKFSPKTRSLS